MSRAARHVLFLAAASVLAVLLVWGLAGLPAFGHAKSPLAAHITRAVVSERHSTEAVTAVVFDYRAFDTLGEEFILFAAAVGTALLLRSVRGSQEPVEARPSAALTTAGAPLAALLVLVGLFVVAHGYITPGGGFQGGLVLATALGVVYLGSGYRAYRRSSPPELIEPVEGGAVGGLVGVGIAGLASGAAFLANVLPLGRAGTLLSAGTIPVLNLLAAAAVAAAFVLLFTEFLEEVASGRQPL